MELDYDPQACFGRHLAATRRQAGVSQEALAHESGLSRSYLSEVERGLRNIALRNICILAETLNIPPAQLLAFEKSPEAKPRARPGRLGSP